MTDNQTSFWMDKKVVIGVSGGIAAYKTAYLVSKLTQLGAKTVVSMTANATRFVSPLTFETLSHNKVVLDLFSDRVLPGSATGHIALADDSDFLILAPATANIIGKIVGGIADDALTTIVMAFRKPIFVVPAMNKNMWNNPFVVGNVKRLEDAGYRIIGPEVGNLACGGDGIGRMVEPKNIISSIETYFQRDLQK